MGHLDSSLCSFLVNEESGTSFTQEPSLDAFTGSFQDSRRTTNNSNTEPAVLLYTV